MKNDEWEKDGRGERIIDFDSQYVGVIDARGNFVFLNSRFQNCLHSHVLALLYKTFFDFIHTEDEESMKQAMAHCLLTGRPSACETRCRKSGIAIQWKVSPVCKNEKAPERFLLLGKDAHFSER